MALFSASESFWRVADAWAQSRRAATGPQSGSISAKEARWRLRASHYLRATPTLAARAWIVPDNSAARDAARLIEGIAEDVIEAMDPVMAAAAFDVWRNWPVATGLSKSLLTLYYSANGTNLYGSLFAGAPYSTYIQSARVGEDRLPTTVRPVRVMTLRAAKAQAEIVARLQATRAGAPR